MVAKPILDPRKSGAFGKPGGQRSRPTITSTRHLEYSLNLTLSTSPDDLTTDRPIRTFRRYRDTDTRIRSRRIYSRNRGKYSPTSFEVVPRLHAAYFRVQRRQSVGVLARLATTTSTSIYLSSIAISSSHRAHL